MELSAVQIKVIKSWIPLYLEKDILVSADQFVDFIVDDQPALFFLESDIKSIFKDNIDIWIKYLEKKIFSKNIDGAFARTRQERWRLVNLFSLRGLMQYDPHYRSWQTFNRIRDDIIQRNQSQIKYYAPDDQFFENYSSIIYEHCSARKRWFFSTSLHPFCFSRDAIEFQSNGLSDVKTLQGTFQIGEPS